MNMQIQPIIDQCKPLTVGLPKKKQENDIEEYQSMNVMYDVVLDNDSNSSDTTPHFVKFKIEQLKQHPEHYFNFGFTYNDFKAYLMKLTYCRAMRKFAQRKRMERIEEFQKTNQFPLGQFGYQHDYEKNTQ